MDNDKWFWYVCATLAAGMFVWVSMNTEGPYEYCQRLYDEGRLTEKGYDLCWAEAQQAEEDYRRESSYEVPIY